MIPSRRGGYRVESTPNGQRLVPDGDWAASASEGAAIQAGNGPTGGFNLTLMGVGLAPNWGQSSTTLDFFDINGDRLPDSIEEGHVRLQRRRSVGASYTTFAPDRPIPGMANVLRRSNDRAMRSGFSIGSAAGGIRRAGKETGSISGRADHYLGYLGFAPSFGFSEGRSSQVNDFVDINGDGLPDQISADGDSMFVRLNLGTSFAPPVELIFAGGVGKDDPEERGFDAIAVSTSLSSSVEFGYLGSGGGLSWNYSYGHTRFIDMNGDGLPDRVWVPSTRGKLRVRFNLGTNFSEPVDWNAPLWGSTGYSVPAQEDVLSYSWGAAFKANAGLSIHVGVLFGWGPAINLSLGANFGQQQAPGRISLEDINGDGLVDHVFTPNTAGINPSTNRLFARLNRSGGANLLSAVRGPFGSRIDLDYELLESRVETVGGERVDIPSARYVLSRVAVPASTFDNADGTRPEYVTTASYSGGFYDRVEREDYGFSRVTVCNSEQTCSVTTYNNQSYLLRGLVAGSFVRDAAGRRTSGNEVEHELSTTGLPTGVTHVRPRIERSFIYDGITPNPVAPSITTEVERVYDAAGLLQSIVDRGEPGNNDDVQANITEYFTAAAPYNIVRPRVIEVRDFSGALLRRREASFGAVGQLSSMTDRLTGGTNPATGLEYANHPMTSSFTYDGYGNVATVTDPAGMVLTYGYDSTFTHRTTVTDGFGLSSTVDFDLRFGLPTKTTDTNGHSVHVRYDDWGRTVAIFGPNEHPLASSPLISHEYQLQPGVTPSPRAWAVTHHTDALGTNIRTVTFIDRTMRVVQTKKTGELDSGSGTATVEGWIVSGPIEYDALGRPRRAWRGEFDRWSAASEFVNVARTGTDPNTRTDYDSFGRARVVQAPDATKIRTDYFVAPIPDQTALRLHTRVTDPLGHERHSFARANGQVIEVRENNTISGGSTLLRTRYGYDSLGRLITIHDADDNLTEARYDSLGRMVRLDNRDSGAIEYLFTAAGDLGAKITPNLRAAPNQRITYVYDRHRLTQVQYPDGRVTELTYGGPGAWGNGAGRLQYRSDDSGSTWFAYGSLGETTTTWRYLRPAGGVSSWTWVQTQFESDSFGRQRSVTYNDGEVVRYAYDAAGNLRSVVGTRPGGSTRDYISFVGYDQYGQRARLRMGNGTETRYNRDPLMQRLQHVETDGPGANAIQRLFYAYNDAGNITERHQQLPSVMGGDFGGQVDQSFSYDELGQLTSASGYYRETATNERRYTLNMGYDRIGNITEKVQTDVRSMLGGSSPMTIGATSHEMNYGYQQFGSTRPHAATTVGSRTFDFDANGNQLGWVDSDTGGVRQMVWDEDDRLESVTTDGGSVNFLYDGAGERTHKWSSAGTSVYANAYWTVRNGVQTTKHIFASGQRIASVVSDPATGSQEHWFHSDHLGSTQFVTNESGEVREHHESLPFGEPWIDESAKGERTPFRFTGKELDSETGLQYFGARYYDPRQGQWASVDPALTTYMSRGITEPNGVLEARNFANYSFAWNSPVILTDTDGREVCQSSVCVRFLGAIRLIGGGVAGVAGATAAGASYGTAALPGYALMLYGADQMQAGLQEVVTGQSAESLQHRVVRGLASQAVSPDTANTVANTTEVLTGLALGVRARTTINDSQAVNRGAQVAQRQLATPTPVAVVAVATAGNGPVQGGNGVLRGVIQNGALSWVIQRIEGSNVTGMQAFDEMMAANQGRITQIVGNWSRGELSSNYRAFWSAARLGMTSQQAAWHTFTGTMARRWGFTQVQVREASRNHVEVVFSRGSGQ
jgi:RHS repeat-associated protein